MLLYNEKMDGQSITGSQLYSLLEGTWIGDGRGEYPTIPSFDYRESLTFTRRDGLSLAYEQRTQKRYDRRQNWLVSHWEDGFIRVLENSELELVNAQSGGRSEVLIGTLEVLGHLIRIHFRSRAITNDPRMVCTERVFELEGDRLRYKVEMRTTAVDCLLPHLRIDLKQVKEDR